MLTSITLRSLTSAPDSNRQNSPSVPGDFNIIGSYSDPFSGVFDGNGKRISNFIYTSTDTGYTGLFSHVSGENAQIRNLGLVNANIDAMKRKVVWFAGWLPERCDHYWLLCARR